MLDVRQSSVVFKIHNGTLRSDVNLCVSCRYSQHTIAANSNKEQIRCIYSRPIEMTELIVKCNVYSDKCTPSLDDMQEIAWSLQTDKGGKAIGFLSPAQLKNKLDRIT